VKNAVAHLRNGVLLFLGTMFAMQGILYAFFFVLGALMASFIGVVVARLYTGQSAVRGHSRCDVCGTSLSPYVLMPIFSYIVSGGRSRCCHTRITPTAPLGELVLGSLFVLSYVRIGITLELCAFLIALSLLAALVLYDAAHQILPPSLLALFVLASATKAWLSTPVFAELYPVLFMACGFAIFFAVLHGLSKGRAMGLADSPLVFGLALLGGSSALAGFLFSFWIGAGVGILLLAGTPRGSRMGIEVPFAPFLAAGFLLAYFTQWNPLVLIARIFSLG